MNSARSQENIHEDETSELRKATYQRRKDFAAIKRITEALDEKITGV